MTSTSRARRCGVVALALVLAAGPAQAQTPARTPERPAPAGVQVPATRDVVGVMPLEIRGKLDEHITRALEDRFAAGLQRGGLAVVPADDLRTRTTTPACDLECLRAAAVAAGATHLVRTQIAVEGRDYHLQVVLLRAASGEQVAALNETCEICGHDELADRIDDLAAAVRRKLSAAVEPPPRLRVLSKPDGSIVTIDGEVVGVTPFDQVVAAGEHDVVIQKRGLISQRRRLAFVDGVTETISDELGQVPTEPAPPIAPRRRWLAPLGWSSIALGLGATAGGVALVALDEEPIRSDCAGPNVDAEGDCKWRHDTLAGGIVMTVAGVAAIAIGAVIVAVERQRGRKARAAATAWSGGLGVRF